MVKRLTPIDRVCKGCGTMFTQQPHRYGGGNPAKYCSHHCGCKHRSKVKTLQKLGLTYQEYEQKLEKCFNRCQGCNKPVTKDTACVDHNHSTGKFRGILCRGCNFLLGHACDSKAVLRQLMAYLDYDHAKTYIYLIGALKNPEIPKIAAKLRKEGFSVWDEWHAAGPRADDHWQAYEAERGRTFGEALSGTHAQDVFHFDKAHLSLADKAVLVMPAGKSGHLELGYFVGTGKPGFILLDKEPERFDIMPNFAELVCSSYEELIRRLKCVST